jgi:ATP/ADP translocase
MKPILEYRQPSTQPERSRFAGLVSIIAGVLAACPTVIFWLPARSGLREMDAFLLAPFILLLTGLIFGGMASVSQTSNRKLGRIGLAINCAILVYAVVIVCHRNAR